MEPEGSLPHSQASAACPYPGPAQSSIKTLSKITSLYYVVRSASWSSGQSLCLLIMRSRVRFPVLPWEFSLKGRIPAVSVVWVGQ